MKTLTVIALLLLAGSTFAQTSVIANKSHSGSNSSLALNTDKFGMIEPAPVKDTVIFIGKSCIVEIGTRWGNDRFRDTICDHFYFKQHGYTQKVAKGFYPSQVKLIGFKKNRTQNNDGSSIQPFFNNGNPQQNGVVGLFALVLISLLAYLFIPTLKKSK